MWHKWYILWCLSILSRFDLRLVPMANYMLKEVNLLNAFKLFKIIYLSFVLSDIFLCFFFFWNSNFKPYIYCILSLWVKFTKTYIHLFKNKKDKFWLFLNAEDLIINISWWTLENIWVIGTIVPLLIFSHGKIQRPFLIYLFNK